MKAINIQPTTNKSTTKPVKHIDSAIHSMTEILDQIGDLRRGDKVMIQCRDQAEWTHFPTMIKTEFPHSVLRCTRTMDDLTPIIKITVIS